MRKQTLALYTHEALWLIIASLVAPVSLVALGSLGGHGEALALAGRIVVLGLLEQALHRVDDLP